MFTLWFIISASIWVIILFVHIHEIVLHFSVGKGSSVTPVHHGILCASTLTAASYLFNW